MMRYQSVNFGGTYDFRSRFHIGWVMACHLHEYSELLYCKRGTCIARINGIRITVPTNHLLWIPPNYLHQYDCKNAEVVCAVFSNDFIPLFFHTTKGKRPIVTPINVADLSDIMSQLLSLDGTNLLLISGYLNLICEKVIAQSEFEPARLTDSILYQKVITYLSCLFQEDISLNQIAKEFGYNPKYLSHALHELTGIHFSRLLSLYRVENAKKLLLSHKVLTIAEIAQSSGFSAVNTFNRVFKEMTGVTPSEYRIE